MCKHGYPAIINVEILVNTQQKPNQESAKESVSCPSSSYERAGAKTCYRQTLADVQACLMLCSAHEGLRL